MYTQHFNLREPPFSIAPDPAYLYLSAQHQEALGHLLYGTGQYGGFVQLAGEVGTGKTTVMHTLLSQKLGTVDVAMIQNPRLNEVEFVAAICDELGISYDKPARSIKPLVDALNEHLLQVHAAGRRTVLIIDEAQNLDPRVLEQVRLLTNLETDKEKLLRIMLIGQPELIELLERPDLRQLSSRITTRYRLHPLSLAETMQYIIHRLRVAGGASDLFDLAAMRRVHRYAQGIPRQINIVCDRALLGAYARRARTVTAETVDQAAAEALGLDVRPQAGAAWLPALRKRLAGGVPLRWIEGALAVAALLVAGVLLSERLERHRSPASPPAAAAAPQRVAAQVPAPAAAPSLQAPAAQAPASQAPAPQAPAPQAQAAPPASTPAPAVIPQPPARANASLPPPVAAALIAQPAVAPPAQVVAAVPARTISLAPSQARRPKVAPRSAAASVKHGAKPATPHNVPAKKPPVSREQPPPSPPLPPAAAPSEAPPPQETVQYRRIPKPPVITLPVYDSAPPDNGAAQAGVPAGAAPPPANASSGGTPPH